MDFQSLIITDRFIEIWNISGMASVYGWGYVCMSCLLEGWGKQNHFMIYWYYCGHTRFRNRDDVWDIRNICEVELVWVYIGKWTLQGSRWCLRKETSIVLHLVRVGLCMIGYEGLAKRTLLMLFRWIGNSKKHLWCYISPSECVHA